MDTKIKAALVRMFDVYGLLPNPNPDDWVARNIPLSMDQLKAAYPYTPVCRGRVGIFRKDNGLRYIFNQREAARGPESADPEEVLSLRRRLVERRKGLVKGPSLN